MIDWFQDTEATTFNHRIKQVVYVMEHVFGLLICCCLFGKINKNYYN